MIVNWSLASEKAETVAVRLVTAGVPAGKTEPARVIVPLLAAVAVKLPARMAPPLLGVAGRPA